MICSILFPVREYFGEVTVASGEGFRINEFLKNTKHS